MPFKISVMGAPLLHDLACVVHLHSTHSDGTGTVAQIVSAGQRAGVDVVILTDHNTRAGAGEEGWHGTVLLLVGEEDTPGKSDHTLLLGPDLRFAAHPFSRGSERFSRFGDGMPHTGLASPDLTGIELWSFVTDTAERVRSVREGLLFAAAPLRVIDHPPERNMVEWDRMCRSRRVVALGGLDAHQIGVRWRGRVPLRLMGYARSFRQLRTHVLCSALPTGSLEHDRTLVYDALREGSCYIAVDALAPARGFGFWGDGNVRMGAEAPFDGQPLHVRLPRPASELRLLRNGAVVESVRGAALDVPASGPGTYRVEARLEHRGRALTWILSNPVYLRAATG
ncbi:MAG: hypothetical protein QOF55_941 [Thermoleophilaceae bacterium]|nr:hypothetical protein [Thermoleophilaceae bacterium]